MRRLPPLSTLRAFEATARLGSVSRAAQELGRTHGAVSRQIRTLHEHAGIALFDKAGTGLALNPHGIAFQSVVARVLDDLERGYRDLLEDARGPGVHVACSATFAMRWLVSNLPGFYLQHPEIRVRLSMTSAREIRHEGADLVIAWDRASYTPEEETRAIPLAPVAFGPVCAPGYAVRVTRDALICAQWIDHEFTSRAWTLWEGKTGRAASARGVLTFPHTHLCIGAALSGLGVALIERRMVREEIADGRLVAPCGFTSFGERLAAVPTSARAESRAAQAFIAWLRDALSAEPGDPPAEVSARRRRPATPGSGRRAGP